ncbi:MAG: hypothetical protein DRP64_17825 [Verrucomicrobia bacterium]|nr:MAG: hypothetical protein DRP64_17825 [Verrucomicrobiota bacterium]
MTNAVSEKPRRIAALDQLRGYAIFGMLLVNAKGLFGLDFVQLKHHKEIFTFADTIAPLFMFIVGMGMRLSWLRRSRRVGVQETRKSMFKRFSILALIAFAIYPGWYWDALMDIGLAGLLAVLLIDKKTWIRIVGAFGMVGVYQAIHMFTSYGQWNTGAIKYGSENTPLLVKLIPMQSDLFGSTLNGGPLGPMSWCMMLLLGTVAYDMMAAKDEKKFFVGSLAWGIGLCAAAYALHVPWGEFKEAWPFSARYMTAPFPLWASGLCFFQLLAFYVVCDKLHFRIPSLTCIGMNPLFIYIISILLIDVIEGLDVLEMSLPAGFGGFALFYGIFVALAYWMCRKNIYIKI